MQWKDDYKIGISVIDAQHKHLFIATNELSEAVSKGLTPAIIDNLLTQLGLYAVRHFQMEEHYMTESSYPDLPEQRQEHQYFTQRFTEITEDFKQNGLSPSIVHAIQNELGLWLKDHVLGLDQAFGAYYATVQTKKTE
jgi:hemerythrin